jgi:hypothetical protein
VAIVNLSFPKIASGLDSHRLAESAHDWEAMLAIVSSLGSREPVSLSSTQHRLEACAVLMDQGLS